jgi:hypothetical protein
MRWLTIRYRALAGQGASCKGGAATGRGDGAHVCARRLGRSWPPNSSAPRQVPRHTPCSEIAERLPCSAATPAIATSAVLGLKATHGNGVPWKGTWVFQTRDPDPNPNRVPQPARMLPIGPGGLQSGFRVLRYVRRDFRKKTKPGPRTPRPPGAPPVLGSGFLSVARGRAA